MQGDNPNDLPSDVRAHILRQRKSRLRMLERQGFEDAQLDRDLKLADNKITEAISDAIKDSLDAYGRFDYQTAEIHRDRQMNLQADRIKITSEIERLSKLRDLRNFEVRRAMDAVNKFAFPEGRDNWASDYSISEYANGGGYEPPS